VARRTLESNMPPGVSDSTLP